MFYLKTIKYLYGVVLKGLDYQEQPTILKPFYAISALCLCVLIAIPICSAVSRMADAVGTLKNENNGWLGGTEKR